MEISQHKKITMGIFAVSAMLIGFAIYKFISFIDYRARVAEAGDGVGSRFLVEEYAKRIGAHETATIPLLLLIAACCLAYMAFRRLSVK